MHLNYIIINSIWLCYACLAFFCAIVSTGQHQEGKQLWLLWIPNTTPFPAFILGGRGPDNPLGLKITQGIVNRLLYSGSLGLWKVWPLWGHQGDHREAQALREIQPSPKPESSLKLRFSVTNGTKWGFRTGLLIAVLKSNLISALKLLCGCKKRNKRYLGWALLSFWKERYIT